MAELSKRATIYLDPALHRALRVKAAAANRTFSGLVNDAVAVSARGKDWAAFAERVAEPTGTYEQLLADLKAHGKI